MKTEVIIITPGMAKKCLERNKIENRNLSRGRVNAMVSDLKNGKWVLTHQGIAFDDEGNLLDGQHRLAACVQSGVSFETLVTKGMTKEVCVAIDNTRPRTIIDHAKQLGLDMSTSHSSIAIIMEYGAGYHDHLSVDCKLDLIRKYSDAIGFAVAISRSATGFQAPSKAVIARAYYTRDHDKLKRFMDVYISMVPEGIKESAAMALRKYLTSSRLYGWTVREEMYQKTESALDNFLKRIPMSKVYGTERELFPIPEIEL